MTTKRAKCPHCGNTSSATIQDNGLRSTDPDLTFLCVKPCAPEDSSFDHLPMSDPDRRVCGMQWCPADDCYEVAR